VEKVWYSKDVWRLAALQILCRGSGKKQGVIRMELIYQVITQPDEADYRAYAKAHIKSRSGKKVLISMLAGVALIATALIPWARMGFSPLYLIPLAMGIGCFVADPLSLHFLEKRLLESMPDDLPRQEFRFDAEGFQLRYKGEKMLYKYPDVMQAVETDGHYFLYLTRQMALILPKADFAQGQAAGFAAFLKEKGVALAQVKL
jgi:hypothetical protein